MNGCVNFLLFSTIPNKQGAHCNSNGGLTQIEPQRGWLAWNKPLTILLTHLLALVYLTYETCKPDNPVFYSPIETGALP
jgi:hypothetical protein